MANNQTGRRTVTVVALLATFCAAAVVGAEMVGGLSSRPVDGRGPLALLVAAALAVTAVLWVVWQSRARAARRWNAALEAYAEREIARARGRHAGAEQRLSTRGSFLPGPRASQTSPSRS
jgi:hypothetical protein